jgi:phage gpG-like protein
VTWRVIAHTDSAIGYLEQCADWVGHTAPEEIAREASETLLEEAVRAFAEQRNPRTGAAWAQPAERTREDPGFKSLLKRSELLINSLRAGYKPNPAGARGFLNLETHPYPSRKVGTATTLGVGLIHLYGVEQKTRRHFYRTTPGTGFVKLQSRARKRKLWAMPARGFIGISPWEFRELIAFADKTLGRVLK